MIEHNNNNNNNNTNNINNNNDNNNKSNDDEEAEDEKQRQREGRTLLFSFCDLCDDTLALILSHMDFISAVLFVTNTSKTLRRRIVTNHNTNEEKSSLIFHHLWKMMFYRQFFAPPYKDGSHYSSTNIDYLSECRSRREMILKLCSDNNNNSKRLYHNDNHTHSKRKCNRDNQSDDEGSSRRRRNVFNCLLSLPNQYFHFSPVTPSSIIDNDTFFFDDNDPPPVDYACQSYVLTDPAIGGEIVFLDPFHGTITVHSDISSHFLKNDDDIDETALIENVMSKNRVGSKKNLKKKKDETTKNKKLSTTQTLFGVEDYFNLDLSDYFPPRRKNNNSHSITHNNINNTMARIDTVDEVVVDWVGIDNHIILEEDPTIAITNTTTTIHDDDYDYFSRIPTKIRGSMIGGVRVITNETTTTAIPSGQDSITCTEILGWTKLVNERNYNTKYVCRFYDFPYFIDISATLEKAFVVFSPGDGPHHRYNNNNINNRSRRYENHHNDIDTSMENDILENVALDENGIVSRRSRVIVQYPILRLDDESNINDICTWKNNSNNDKMVKEPKFFPKPERYIKCLHPVSSFTIDSTGRKLIVGTEKGTVEIWDTGLSSSKSSTMANHSRCPQPRRLQSLSISQLFQECQKQLHLDYSSSTIQKEHQRTRQKKYSSTTANSNVVSIEVGDNLGDDHLAVDDHDNLHTAVVTSDDNGSDNYDSGLKHYYYHNNINVLVSPQCKPCRKIERVFVPTHLPVEHVGFVTLQHHSVEGSTLYLWKPRSTLAQFEMRSLINLPLSPQRSPQIHYDGKRIVVFGKDHIGMIILVYQIFSSWEINKDRNDEEEEKNNRAHGRMFGITNFKPKRMDIRFVNRIRHAALGGLEYEDNIFMTCNERFIILNTKTGNLLEGKDDGGASDGLLIIDLKS